ncbi:MAG: GGDEF domain-containing protein [Thiomargarita sp.]|nr:GGDEF domain-containing protein [Thiomargarita sp.]
MEQLIKQTLKTATSLVKNEQATLFSVSNKYNGIILGGLNKEKFRFLNQPIKLKNTPLEELVITKRTYSYYSTTLHSVIFPSHKKADNELKCLCLPLINASRQMKGIIAFTHKKEDLSIFHEQLELLKIITPLFAAIIEIGTQNQRLIASSTRDHSTALYTKHYFDTRLLEEFTRIRRHGGIISLLLVEIDNFEQVKKICGDDESNLILEKTVSVVTDCIRHEIDIPCRYGNDMVAMLLPNTNIDGAYILAERIRQRCELHSFTTLKGIPLKVTVSIGIAHNIDITHEIIPKNNDKDDEQTPVKIMGEVSKEEFLHRASMMLNAARQAGHNKVMVWW